MTGGLKYRYEVGKMLATELLEKFNTKNNAIVAGGFPRDYILSHNYDDPRIVNDIDVYIEYDKELEKELKKLGFRTGKSYGFDKKGLNGLKSVYKMELFKSKGLFKKSEKFEVQLILIENEEDSLEEYVNKHFDLSICKVIFDGTGFKELPDFKKTMETKEITLTQTLGTAEFEWACRRHIKKISDRFSSYKQNYYNKDFYGVSSRCKLVKRTRLAEKMIGDKWLYRNDGYIFWDEEAVYVKKSNRLKPFRKKTAYR